MDFNKKIVPLVLAATISQSFMSTMAFAGDNLTPNPGTYGYYVDNLKNNNGSNMTPSSNPSIGVLSEFLKIFTPGSSWNNGTVSNNYNDVHEHNIDTVIDMTSENTTPAAVSTTSGLAQVYLDDRRNQSYSVTDGFGNYTDLFRTLAGAQTSIPNEVPADATTKQYVEKYNNLGDPSGNNWADENSELGNTVKLIDKIRNSGASTSQAKTYYQYMRPFRWSSDVKVLPTLVPEESSDPTNDGGFPSGHTNAAYVTSIGLAYAAPERFQELLTRASELGNDRIRAGMHSPLDVMGGRINATAVVAAVLNDPNNASLKEAAYNDAQTKLFTQAGTSKDRFSDYEQNKADYIKRLTYGFTPIGDTTKPMVVPKGAEVLLETRLPYLDANQRRDVLYTTGLPSGYPLLDDPEGWGRLNLFSAADGYGAFNSSVTVNMDAAKGGFNSSDSWRNDISGVGSLVKQGTGTLKLDGDNTYSGGTQIQQGTIEADSATAFGTGSVINNGGTLLENVAGTVDVKSDYTQAGSGALELSIGSKNDVFEVDGNATFSGKLKLDFNNGYIPENSMTIITFKDNSQNSRFSSIETTGLPSNYTVNLVYDNNDVKLLIGTSGSSSSSSSHHDSSSSTSDSTSLNTDTNSTDTSNESNKDNKTGGEVKTGWQQKNGIWYHLKKDGTINTGWFKDENGKWYYLDQSGAMKKGWLQDVDGKWYYLDDLGAMQTGWLQDTDGEWYYLDETGNMKTGWFQDIDEQWYYLNESGTMEHDKYIDGYYVDSNGVWVNN
jgi:autotransporter-associated beta strand protein